MTWKTYTTLLQSITDSKCIQYQHQSLSFIRSSLGSRTVCKTYCSYAFFSGERLILFIKFFEKSYHMMLGFQYGCLLIWFSPYLTSSGGFRVCNCIHTHTEGNRKFLKFYLLKFTFKIFRKTDSQNCTNYTAQGTNLCSFSNSRFQWQIIFICRKCNLMFEKKIYYSRIDTFSIP